MTAKKHIIALGVVFLALITGAGVFVFDSQRSTSTNLDNISELSAEESTDKTLTEAELADFDGLDGNKCYAVVDGVVYDLSNFGLWRNGVHSPSGGLASCGRDLSDVITQSPHGKSKLNVVPVVGTYSN
jgi:predicted heme/steroid binding protein